MFFSTSFSLICCGLLEERCLEPDEKPAEIMKSWGDAKGDNAPKFVFKKKTFIRHDDREMEDPVARNLLYIQVTSSFFLDQNVVVLDFFIN